MMALTGRVQNLSELVRLHVVKPQHIKSLLSTVVVTIMSSSLPRTVSSFHRYLTLRV